MSVNQALPRARPRTFGVELEFIILWLWNDEPDPYQDEAGELAPILRIPRDHSTTLTYTDIEKIIYDMICDVLNSHGLPAQRWQRAPEYSSWAVKPDVSIMLTGEKVNWHCVELTSPAERASPDAFKAISYALDLISSTYRIMVNDTCGFHVHVGDGKETMPLEHVRRVASLLWAADPIIATLHPPERRTNPFSRSIREYSPLARGKKIADVLSQANHSEEHTCIRYIGRSHRHGEQPISWRIENQQMKHVLAFEDSRAQGSYNPFFYDETKGPSGGTIAPQTTDPGPGPGPTASEMETHIEEVIKTIDVSKLTYLNSAYSPTIKRLGPRFSLPERGPDIVENWLVELDERAKTDIGVFAAVSEIYACESSCVVLLLLETRERPNYNLLRYICYNLMDPGTNDPTIEFRQAAGTTSGEWAEIWARICVGLIDFAIHAPPDRFISVLEHLEYATSGEASYDVVDLLDEIGLFAESVFAEKRLTQYKDEWGLKYESESQEKNDLP
ncbi:hypothetical protein Daesc_001894 [Daldinia eschscholtzii]|uniref:Amidoligase enzyme n=1 Tax=Daldinia eschscholtzii TaxID=292717 RepID=A0AAX6MVH5_9PEZI